MPVHRLQYSQVLPASMDQSWNFFSSPENLCRITPDWLCFDIKNKDAQAMYPGLIIQYTIKAVGGIPMNWTTEITHVDKPHFFVDEQRVGPYRFWHHQHLFKETSSGIEVTDIVHYSLYMGLLTEPINWFMVRPRLEEIFTYRKQALNKIFPG
ncbi:MAG: hypothetical protein ABR542_08935 [Desulfonatronovibrio sp.]